MKCSLCNKDAVVNYGFSKPICKEHFLKNLISRVKKHLRKCKVFEDNKGFLFLDDSSDDFKTMFSIIKPIIEIERRKYIIKKIKSRHNFKKIKKIESSFKIFIPWTANDSATIFIKNILEGKNPVGSENKNFIKPLECVLDSESFLFSVLSEESKISKEKEIKIKNREFFKNSLMKNKELIELSNYLILKQNLPDKEIRFFLNRIEEIHPGTIFSILTTIRKIEDY